MKRIVVLCGVALLCLGGVCQAQETTQKPAEALQPGPTAIALPGGVSPDWLGFGSTTADVERIMGKPAGW